MTNISRRNASVCGKNMSACRRSAIASKRPRRPWRHSCCQGRVEAPAAHRVHGQSSGSAPGGLAEWVLRVAQPPAPRPRGSCAARGGQRTTRCCPGAGHVRYAPAQGPVSSRGVTRQPPSSWAWAGPRRAALPNTAPVPSAPCCGAGPDRGLAPAQSGVDSAGTSYGVGWRHSLSAYGRRLGVSRRRPGAGLACRGRRVHGRPSAGRGGEPGVSDGARSASARSGTPHAYRPWPSVGR